jgi:hypothetical protein
MEVKYKVSKTKRIIAPDWQGGNKREYYFGADLYPVWLLKMKTKKKSD